MTKNTVDKIKSALLVMKTKQKIAFAFALLINLYLSQGGMVFYIWFFRIPEDPGILGGLLGVICAFGVLLGEAIFKITLPQKAYIERSKFKLIMSEFGISVGIGTFPFLILLFMIFGLEV